MPNCEHCESYTYFSVIDQEAVEKMSKNSGQRFKLESVPIGYMPHTRKKNRKCAGQSQCLAKQIENREILLEVGEFFSGKCALNRPNISLEPQNLDFEW